MTVPHQKILSILTMPISILLQSYKLSEEIKRFSRYVDVHYGFIAHRFIDIKGYRLTNGDNSDDILIYYKYNEAMSLLSVLIYFEKYPLYITKEYCVETASDCEKASRQFQDDTYRIINSFLNGENNKMSVFLAYMQISTQLMDMAKKIRKLTHSGKGNHLCFAN